MSQAVVIDLTLLSDSDEEPPRVFDKSDNAAHPAPRPDYRQQQNEVPPQKSHSRTLLPSEKVATIHPLRRIERSGRDSHDSCRVSAQAQSAFGNSLNRETDDYPGYLTQWAGGVEEDSTLCKTNQYGRRHPKNRGPNHLYNVAGNLALNRSGAGAITLLTKAGEPLNVPRHSSLIDNLPSDSDSRTNSNDKPLPNARQSAPLQKTMVKTPIDHKNTSKRQHPTYTIPSISRVPASSVDNTLKRPRLDDSTKDNGRQRGTGAEHNPGAVHAASQTMAQIGKSYKRRGRPPGSRNKQTLVVEESRSKSLGMEQLAVSAPDNSPNDMPLVHYARSTQTHTMASILRHRELGGYPALNTRNLQKRLRQVILDGELLPWKSWEGASKDVITVAWSPDGVQFAAGASTDLDELNLRYNRNNNLLWGNAELGCLGELADHYLPRSRPAVLESNAGILNSYNTLDPRVFTTVSSICFDGQGQKMYTGSYDNTVKVWDISKSDELPKCVSSLRHTARVELLSGSVGNSGHVLATAQCDSKQAISVFGLESAGSGSLLPTAGFTSGRAEKMGFFPTALRWGNIPSGTEHLLLAGFGENKNDERDRDRQGDLLLWDVSKEAPSVRLSPNAQCVFDVVWHPRLPIMAAATTPGSYLSSRTTRSVVRTWAPSQGPSRIIEFECPALDVNEICFHPFDSNYIGVACTNGCAYLWDIRRPDNILHTMQHDNGIEEIDQLRAREEQDTGMRFISWSVEGSALYTGSSDGTIKQWSPFSASEDLFVRDVASFDSGVMCGSFSPDYSNLLVGLCKGSVQMLSSAPPAEPGEDIAQFSLMPSPSILGRAHND
ncbi:MAG: hypothetical protein LQ340_001072 [Diploschistes diacapsis]|nr:MAG: hypothetical protein LQ340_001072 [Diploschistes diacapsis]